VEVRLIERDGADEVLLLNAPADGTAGRGEGSEA